MIENWKDILGYEGLYQVSDLGNVRSIDRYVFNEANGDRRHLKGRVLRPLFSSNGYMFVGLSKNGKKKLIRIHRLVALAFIPNHENKPEVNHINEDKTDNRLVNLEWITMEENRRYGSRISRGVAHRDQSGKKNGMYGRKGKLSPTSLKIMQYDLNGLFIREYDCIREAAQMTGSNPSSISKAAKGFISQTNGYKWKYKN